MKINKETRTKLNAFSQAYTGYQLPAKMGEFYSEINKRFGVEIPMFSAVSGRASASFLLNGEEVENCRFVWSAYEPTEGSKNDYNFYFS